jgi:hypothetical protein
MLYRDYNIIRLVTRETFFARIFSPDHLEASINVFGYTPFINNGV